MPARISKTIPERVIRRVWSRVFKGHPTACWSTSWSLGSHGRPQVGWHEDGCTRMVLVAEAVWTGVHGPVPQEMTIDHRCRQEVCVNPSHLRLLANDDNARDNRQAQRQNPAWVPGELETCR